MDAIQMLGSAGYLSLDTIALELLLQLCSCPLNTRLPLLPGAPQLAGNSLVSFRLQMKQCQIFHLYSYGLNPQPMAQRSEDMQGLFGSPLSFLGRQMPQSAHVVQPVSKLYQEHTQIGRHGQEHLAQVARLLFLPGSKIELAQLRHAIHQLCHSRSETLLDIFHSDIGILDRIVQQARCYGALVAFDVGQNTGHLQGVDDVWRSAQALLIGMSFGGKFVGTHKQIAICSRPVAGNLFDYLLNRTCHNRASHLLGLTWDQIDMRWDGYG